jgi:hypothetical protein
VAAVSAALAAGAVEARTGDQSLSVVTLLVLVIVLLPGALTGTGLTATVAGRARRAFAGPTARSGALAAVGMALLTAGVVCHVRDDDDLATRDAADLLAVSAYSPPRRPETMTLVTDRGTRIDLSSPVAPRSATVLRDREALALQRAGLHESAIRRAPANERSNCFGWVFANDRYWLTDSAVGPILADNGYRVVAAPRPGDLVVYRSATTGLPAHAGVVRYVTDGMPVLVEGKWGWMGVFLHPADRSPYGSDYAYYRSPRATHQLPVSGPESEPASALTGAE